jgi:hypothetical protein
VKKIIPALIASATGLTVLAGYLFQDQLTPVLGLFINWGILLTGLASLIGIGYLVLMHVKRITHHQKGGFPSAVFLIAFLFTLGAGIILTPQSAVFRDWVLNIQVPVETSLLAILAVTLFYTSLHLIRTRGWTPMSIGFLISALFSLTLNIGYVQFQKGSQGAEWVLFIQRLPLAGLRGILIGMALGGLVVGLRVLLAIDRPYDGE